MSVFDFDSALVRQPAPCVVDGLRSGSPVEPSYAGVRAEHWAYVAKVLLASTPEQQAGHAKLGHAVISQRSWANRMTAFSYSPDAAGGSPALDGAAGASPPYARVRVKDNRPA